MDKIPSKQLHQRASTKTALAARLSEREIGFCDADSTLYIRIGDELLEAVPYLQAIASAKQEILAEIGSPLLWIDDATVAYLNGTIPGLKNGWTYTLTDAGTLTAGNVNVEPGDEVAWSDTGSKWVKIGGDAGKVTIYGVSLSGTTWTYPDASKIDFDIGQGKYVVLKFNDGAATSFYFLMSGPASTSAVSKSIQFYNFSTKGALLASYASNTWTWSANSYSPFPAFSGSAPGLVPAATAGDANKALRGDGTWGDVSTVTVSYDAVNGQLHLDFSPQVEELVINGVTYRTVKIGEQTWMAENLADPGSGVWYDNDPTTYSPLKYGKLYTQSEAEAIAATVPGWHLPTKSDFDTLIGNFSDGSVARTKLLSTSGWYNDTNGDNESGFDCKPSGSATPDLGGSVGRMMCMRSSSQYDTGLHYMLFTDSNSSSIISEAFYPDSYTFSVRLVKDSN